MSEITTFQFNENHFQDIKQYRFGLDWPVVYIIEGDKELYVGETLDIYRRSKQHYDKPERRRLKKIHIIADKEYNKSATLDIESFLIEYIAADGKFVLQNGNHGLQNHDYFDRQKYKAKFEIIWKELQKMSIVKKELVEIKNSDLFKYSPYKTLTEDQVEIVDELLREIRAGVNKTFIINGGPGTGKTILATYLIKRLNEDDKFSNLKIGLVVPMTSLRKTLKKVFKNIKGLRANMIIGPNKVSKKYDILIVDEAHRLRQRRNITNFGAFDNTNKLLELKSNATELDWILHSSNIQILFYDEGQSVRPSDISPSNFSNLNTKKFELTAQLRIGMGTDGDVRIKMGTDGDKYIKFIQDIFDLKKVETIKFNYYDFKIYDDIRKMVFDIKIKNKKFDLCRLVAGYAWPWVSKKDPNKYDIEIDGLKLKWNSVNHNWVYSPNAINEVGCIHTVQGYDLNYTGVIIGPELSYNFEKQKFVVYPKKYMDINGKRGIKDIKELERYIINIYKTLLTRGIRGTYVYIVDDKLRKYFKEIILE